MTTHSTMQSASFSENTATAAFSQLNEQQREAVNTLDGPLLVLAGAGTGKTSVLTSRIANILMQRKAMPPQILAVTFTNKAAREMRERVERIVGYVSEGLWLGTFHSIGVRILRRHAEKVGLKQNFTILDTDDQIRLIKQLTAEAGLDEKRWQPKAIMGLISRWKDKGLLPDTLPHTELPENGEVLAQLYKNYQQRLQSLNAADFGDLLLLNLKLFKEYPEVLLEYQRQFRYILVDEYQDTNISQYLWLRLLAMGHHNICCVGDDDQSIYGWRGAEVGNILRFEKDFGKAVIIRLERNYRSTSPILAAASGLITKNTERLGKTLWTESQGGDLLKLVPLWDDREESRYIAGEIESLQQLKSHSLSQMAILVRAGFQTRAFEECFMNQNIPYKIVGGLRFYERMEIRDVIAYLRLVSQPEDDLALERIINTPKRGIGATTLQRLRGFGKERGIPMLAAAKAMIASGEIKASLAVTFSKFLASVERWQILFSEMALPEATEVVLQEAGYLDMWKQERSTEAEGRLENIKELLRALQEFETLAEFLEHVSLVTDVDDLSDGNMVNIMTLHAAKGLEFDTVFLPGWEEGLFPHQRSMDEKGTAGLEEERRLAYVGITRARKRVYISFTSNRRVYNQWQHNLPSRFIDELPSETIESLDTGNGFSYRRDRSSISSFDFPSFNSEPPKAAAPKKEGIQPGQRVFHQKFGYGTVLNVESDQLEISFEKAGRKKVIARYVEKV